MSYYEYVFILPFRSSQGRDGWRTCSTKQEDEQNDAPVRDPGAPRYCTLSRCTNAIAIDLQTCRKQGFDSFRHSDTLLSAYLLGNFYDLTFTNRPTLLRFQASSSQVTRTENQRADTYLCMYMRNSIILCYLHTLSPYFDLQMYIPSLSLKNDH
jgi:hypothetical protein